MKHTLRSAAWPLLLLAAAGCSASPSDPVADANVVDAPAADASAADVVDAAQDAGGPDAAALVVHGCTDFVDRSADGADRTVNFANFRYDPKCMLVAAGQRVTFAGDFAAHQFRPGVAPSRAAADPAGSPGNPMTARDDGASAAFTFAAAGTFPYFCLDHEGTGMYGAVRVR